MSFSVDGRSYSRESVQLVQLLHYKSLPLHGSSDILAISRSQLSYSDTAEVVLFFDPLDSAVDDGDISRMVLHCWLFITIKESYSDD